MNLRAINSTQISPLGGGNRPLGPLPVASQYVNWLEFSTVQGLQVAKRLSVVLGYLRWRKSFFFFFNGSSRGYWAAADSRYVTRFMVSAETTLLPQWLRKLLEVTSTLNWASKMSEVYFLNTLFHNVNSANYELSNLLPETPKTRTNSDRHE